MNLLDQVTRQANKNNKEQARKTFLFSYKEGHRFTFYVDLETSGGDPIRNDVIEICCLVTRRGEFEVIDKFHSYVRPEQINSVTWSQRAQEVHGITPAQAMTFPERRKVAIDFLNFLVPYKHEENFAQLFVCHAMAQSFFDQKENETKWGMFDFNFLDWLFRKEKLNYSLYKVFNPTYLLSTIWLAQKLGYGNDQLYIDGVPQYTKSGRPKKEGNGLAIWSKRAGFELEHHKAESDTFGCLYVHKFLAGETYFE
jgi:DNA polymerase III epsilon subunit-like protein